MPEVPASVVQFTRATLAIAAAAALAGCTGSTITPSNEPFIQPYPQGVAHATALQNLPLVRLKELASGRNSVLVMIFAAGVDIPTGSPEPGNAWHYELAETLPT